jgi:hypothetical protein
MKARKGDPILCPRCRTAAGTLQSDIQDGAPITTSALGALDCDGEVDDGYRCRECKGPVAVFSLAERVWRIHTSRGWVE